MEASHILRGAMEGEDHGSSESGWTMYIGSSIHENDHYNYIGEYTYNNNNNYKQEDGHCKHRCRDYINSHNDDDESDDSMASDASSGPNHYKFPCNSEQNLGMDPYKHEKTEPISSKKPHNKHVSRRDKRRNKMEKETIELKTTSAASHVQSRDKSNKTNNYMSHKA